MRRSEINDMVRYLSFLEKVLTPARLQHSLGVMQVMGELADIYALNREIALGVGLLHDAAKDLNPSQRERMIEEAAIEIHYPCEHDYVLYLHGPVGSYYIHKELGINDSLSLNAISRHTYYGNGKDFDSPMCWCLRFSDILEPTRDWSKVRWLQEGTPRLREAVFAGRMEEGALIQTNMLIKWFEEEGKPVHPNMRRVYRELSIRQRL